MVPTVTGLPAGAAPLHASGAVGALHSTGGVAGNFLQAISAGGYFAGAWLVGARFSHVSFVGMRLLEAVWLGQLLDFRWQPGSSINGTVALHL